MFTNKKIQAYLDAKKDSLAPTTLASKSSILKTFYRECGDCSAETAIKFLKQRYSPYSQKINLMHLSAYLEFLIEEGLTKKVENGFRKYLKKSSYTMGNAYQKKLPELSYEAAFDRIGNIADEEARSLGYVLISSGLRVSELWSVDHKQGVVLGKGHKQRAYIGPEFTAPTKSVVWLRDKLKEVGLKPHDLRKVFATFLVEKDYPIHDLKAIMGWSSFETAEFYLIVRSREKLKERLKNDLKVFDQGGSQHAGNQVKTT